MIAKLRGAAFFVALAVTVLSAPGLFSQVEELPAGHPPTHPPKLATPDPAAAKDGVVRSAELFSARHMLLLNPMIDGVVGSYMFAVINETGKEVQIASPLFFPKGVTQFGVQDGLTEGDIGLDDSGRLLIRKSFPPGSHLVSYGFLLQGDGAGRAKVTATVPYDIPNLTVIVPGGKMRTESSGAKLVDGPPFNGIPSKALDMGQLKSGADIAVDILDVPQGRMRYWQVGGGFAACLVGLAIALSWRTLPAKSGRSEMDAILGK